MNNIKICDVTLRDEQKNGQNFSFKEKLEIVRQLDKLKVDVIETAPVTNDKADTIFLHTISPLLENSLLSCPVGLDVTSIDKAYDAIKDAKRKRVVISIPVSTVQMEYMCHMKPNKILELSGELAKYACSVFDDVEVSLVDATRADRDFLINIINKVASEGITTLNLCDTAGVLTPTEAAAFISDIKENAELLDVKLSAEFADELHMANACLFASVTAGVSQIKTNVDSMSGAAQVFRIKGDHLGISCNISLTEVNNITEALKNITDSKNTTAFSAARFSENTFVLSSDESIVTIGKAIEKMGYELSADDISKVYEEYKKASSVKTIGSKELDAIIASVALQVAPTYKLKSYVINSGNIITPVAHIVIEKGDEVLEGLSAGDGPIDAAFLAIEKTTGSHYELDDFQIFSVTEGREAMGSAIVKLRSNGKLYSGKGISTDIVGASIMAYVNALNKICYEEAAV